MTLLYIELAHSLAKMPVRATKLSAGFDIYAAIGADGTKMLDSKIMINPGKTELINTGLLMRPEPGYCIKLFPRSGLALKNGITLGNCVGLGDEDYSKPYGVIVHNHSDEPFIITNGMRICQIKVERVEPTKLVLVDKLPSIDSDRTGGFGSTENIDDEKSYKDFNYG